MRPRRRGYRPEIYALGIRNAIGLGRGGAAGIESVPRTSGTDDGLQRSMIGAGCVGEPQVGEHISVAMGDGLSAFSF